MFYHVISTNKTFLIHPPWEQNFCKCLNYGESFNPPHHFCVSHMKVRRDHRGQPQGPLQAAAVEQPAEQLQGAEGPGGGTPQQPEGEPDAVQQTSETCQHHQPRESISATSLSSLFLIYFFYLLIPFFFNEHLSNQGESANDLFAICSYDCLCFCRGVAL